MHFNNSREKKKKNEQDIFSFKLPSSHISSPLLHTVPWSDQRATSQEKRTETYNNQSELKQPILDKKNNLV